MKYAYRFLVGLAALAGSLTAHAVSWTTTNSVALGVAGGSIYCSTTTCNTSGSGLTGSVMQMSAYSTPSSGTPTPESGSWIDAKIAIYGGYGAGITNTLQSSSTEAGYPQHAMDNRVVNDILVVDFGSNNWDVSSFSLGWACTIDSYGTGCSGSTVNVAAWVGGTGAIDFNTVAFSGTGSSATLPGFQALTLSNDPGGTGVKTDSTSHLGRYLVISGDLGGTSSAFKVSGLSAVQVTVPPPQGVPAAGTLPLLLLGAAALGATLRRRRTA
ncbi:MAG: hypothetical protein ACT4P4_02905 [Betaproteobacteria bacterium]